MGARLHESAMQEPIAALRALFRAPAQGSASPELLEKALRLCASLRDEASDPAARRAIDRLGDYAMRLFSGDQPWRYGESPGPQALRLCALRVLAHLERAAVTSM
ncbi:MAG TPA: hypothetical protein VHL85_05075 [Burkholderiales bacterium]|jgi:hypothetical protein|nr:hypothetical protein [Burkholderiales bacterium]